MRLEISRWNLGDARADLTLLSHDTASTEAFGRFLAAHLQQNDIVSLDGDLGAGKTALTRGIAAGLACLVPVSSPTFTLLMEHQAAPGGLALYHFDVYRLSGGEAFCEAGLDEYFDQDGICVIEWGGQIADLLPPRTLFIQLCQGTLAEPDLRRIRLSWPGQPGRLAALAVKLQQFLAKGGL